MFLSLINHYNIRPCEAQYLWTFYNQLYRLKKHEVQYILDDTYLKTYYPEERWEVQPEEAAKHFYIPPEKIECDYYKLNYDLPNFFKPSDNLKIFMKSGNDAIEKLLTEIGVVNKFKAGLTWVNNYAFERYLNGLHIPVIHNELGALRSPLWKDTFYFDFSGVNGHTEFDYRFNEFKKIAGKLDLLSNTDLIKLAAQPHTASTLVDVYNTKDIATHCGVPLQVENDTNLICFNNGWDLPDLLTYAYKQYSKKEILVRNHPGALFNANSRFYRLWDEGQVSSFIRMCKKVITINSSVGFEALLLGRKVEILGENSFRQICLMGSKERLMALNFAVISYLVPVSKLYDVDYYNFRLECKDEVELYKYGLELWRNYRD